MSSRDLKLNSGDSTGCRTHRVVECAKNSVSEMLLKNLDEGCGECTPNSALWRPTKINRNMVVLRRPINNNVSQSNAIDRPCSAKSSDDIVNKEGFPSVQIISKSLSVSDMGKSKTERASTSRKFCKIDSLAESDDDLTVRNDPLVLERNGFYESNGSLRLSLTSLSSSATQEDQEAYEIARREAFNDWLSRKEKERKEKNRAQDNKNHNGKKMTLEQREELFKIWIEKKRSMKEAEKASRLLEVQKQEEEKKLQKMGKENKLREWSRRKEEIMKDLALREKERQEKLARSKEQRRKEGELAYQHWLKQAKNKPLPVPLNKGELSMRGSVSSMYVNPQPWKCSEDNDSASTSST